MGSLLSQTSNVTSHVTANAAFSSNKPTSTFDNILKEHRKSKNVPSLTV